MTDRDATVRPPAMPGPFRVLAGLLCCVGWVLLAGMAYGVWLHGSSNVHLKDVVLLPAILWVMRPAFYAAAYGFSPPQGWWPFASPRVAGFYFLLVTCFSVYGV